MRTKHYLIGRTCNEHRGFFDIWKQTNPMSAAKAEEDLRYYFDNETKVLITFVLHSLPGLSEWKTKRLVGEISNAAEKFVAEMER